MPPAGERESPTPRVLSCRKPSRLPPAPARVVGESPAPRPSLPPPRLSCVQRRVRKSPGQGRGQRISGQRGKCLESAAPHRLDSRAPTTLSGFGGGAAVCCLLRITGAPLILPQDSGIIPAGKRQPRGKEARAGPHEVSRGCPTPTRSLPDSALPSEQSSKPPTQRPEGPWQSWGHLDLRPVLRDPGEDGSGLSAVCVVPCSSRTGCGDRRGLYASPPRANKASSAVLVTGLTV